MLYRWRILLTVVLMAFVAGAVRGQSLSSISPSSAARGGGAFTLTLDGSGFVAPHHGDPYYGDPDTPGSAVRWKGEDRATTFVSGTQLKAAITAADLATAGTVQVTVYNPPPGGASNAMVFTITGSSPPSVSSGGTVNAASFAQGGVSSGIAATFGTNLASSITGAQQTPLPTTLAGVSLRLNNVAAPLFFVSPNQINFQVPWEMLGQSQASLTVTADGLASTPVLVNMAQFAPGIFTLDSSGRGQGAIVIAGTATLAAPAGSVPNRDARPVKRGEEFIAIFSTGLGDVTNRPANGAPSPFQPPFSETSTRPTATIGGVPATVVFSGLAPFFVGLYQVNVQVPQGAPVGDAVLLVLSIGGVASNTVSIAVE